MSKKEVVKQRFCEWVLNSYIHFIIRTISYCTENQGKCKGKSIFLEDITKLS